LQQNISSAVGSIRRYQPAGWRRQRGTGTVSDVRLRDVIPRLGPHHAAAWIAARWTLAVTLLLSRILVDGRTSDLLRCVNLWLCDQTVCPTLRPVDTPKVAVVALDEASLARNGQRPRPGDLLAELVRRLLDEHGARASAFDIVFAEPDRSDVEVIRQRMDAVPGGPVVLGCYFSGDAACPAAVLPWPFPPACRFRPRDVVAARDWRGRRRQSGATDDGGGMRLGLRSLALSGRLHAACAATGRARGDVVSLSRIGRTGSVAR
jgi:CHASE2 domain-containing sensor protein